MNKKQNKKQKEGKMEKKKTEERVREYLLKLEEGKRVIIDYRDSYNKQVLSKLNEEEFFVEFYDLNGRFYQNKFNIEKAVRFLTSRGKCVIYEGESYKEIKRGYRWKI